MTKGKLIVIDGIDGSGKGTQTALLVSRLKKAGQKAVGLNFPQYETQMGHLIVEYLSGKYGIINPYLAALLYATNRYEFKGKILDWLESGYILVLNRYISSNQIHQAANIDSKKDRRQFVDWISKLEYGTFGLPHPDLIFFLNLPAEVSYELVIKKSKHARRYIKGTKRDILESDLTHQRKALKQAHEVLKHYGEKTAVIECFEKGKLLHRNKISDRIWQQLTKLIGLR